ncbi:MAG: hypothetical protein NT113_25455 [Hyphomicrobiales bacterium]|nr:hypothetical protein [Hyphomicrobiales bacterium]
MNNNMPMISAVETWVTAQADDDRQEKRASRFTTVSFDLSNPAPAAGSGEPVCGRSVGSDVQKAGTTSRKHGSSHDVAPPIAQA